jgi:hypothetical protein
MIKIHVYSEPSGLSNTVTICQGITRIKSQPSTMGGRKLFSGIEFWTTKAEPPIYIELPCFAYYDGYNGWYYQIGVMKYIFLDYERYSNSLSSGC